MVCLGVRLKNHEVSSSQKMISTKPYSPLSFLRSLSPSLGEKQRLALREFIDSLGKVKDITEFYRLLEKIFRETITPQFFYLFLLNNDTNELVLFSPANLPINEVAFPHHSPFIELLRKKGKAIALMADETLPKLSQSDRAKLTLLDVNVCYPLQTDDRLIGFIGLGHPAGKVKYTREDHFFVEEICRLATLLLNHLLEKEEIEQQIQQMETLNRLSQGINVTLHFDDLLELIYAQTESILPLTDFWLSTYDPETQVFSFVFVVEDGERRFDQENVPLNIDEHLEKLVLQKAKALHTDDYNQTARLYGIAPKHKSIQAWMCVPLLSGKDTLGTISIGHRLIGIAYTKKQLQILQAISDQTAAALVKIRLLKATQTQAQRMTVLNEIGSRLTASLEPDTILGIVQEQGQKLIPSDEWIALFFNETSNDFLQPRSKGLQKIHFDSPISEIIQEAFQLGQTVVKSFPKRFEEAKTVQVLCHPLFIEKRPLGVLVLKRETIPTSFSGDDLELITTLGNQVSIALANALKYTQTDQALQQRLNELATLQQIDRELNASLEIERTLAITLQHALQHSTAEGGAIGLVKDNFFSPLHLVGYEGIPSTILLEEIGINSSITDALLIEKSLFLEGAQKSLVFPLEREGRVIALLILESRRRDFCPPDTHSFISRLCSHAAMALSNAILYSEVQQANHAKSEFVSLVSHELKTPMTAIKGYADLIAQGAVGPINEVQANFLSTIRANVNRMANLVSDLADVSRIEAGRLHLEFEATSIQEVLEEVIRTVSTQLEEKKQQVILDIPADLPLVWCDRNRLIQIYNNLVSNAIKYSPSETMIEVKCLVTTNSKEQQSTQKMVLSSVRDQGVGISIEDQPKIFQKFFRSEDPKVRENPGTGLGLNITKYLVEIQGGQIWFESEVGEGTTFYFTVPVASVD